MHEMIRSSTLPTLTLQILPTDASDPDPALLSAIASETTSFFQERGETVHPVYTGQRGGELLLQIITSAWTNKEIILSDLSALVGILTPVVLAAQHITNSYKKRVGKDTAQQHPITITVEVNGITMKVEAPDSTNAEAVATHLAQHVLAQPLLVGEQKSSSSTPLVQVRVPKRPTGKKR